MQVVLVLLVFYCRLLSHHGERALPKTDSKLNSDLLRLILPSHIIARIHVSTICTLINMYHP